MPATFSPTHPQGPIAILGAGLLGGSLALALHDRIETRLWARREDTCTTAKKLGLNATTDLSETLQDATIIVLCTPVGSMPTLLTHVTSCDPSPYAIITDVGSVKNGIVPTLDTICQHSGLTFLSSHPMAGAETAGITSARSNLFQGTRCLLTPSDSSTKNAVSILTKFWSYLGCSVSVVTVQEHDHHIARISHMPHLLSAALVTATLGNDPTSGEMAAGGFRDMTRVAAGSPEMWREILMANRHETAHALEKFAAETKRCLHLLNEERHEELLDFLTKAQHLRHACYPPNP